MNIRWLSVLFFSLAAGCSTGGGGTDGTGGDGGSAGAGGGGSGGGTAGSGGTGGSGGQSAELIAAYEAYLDAYCDARICEGVYSDLATCLAFNLPCDGSITVPPTVNQEMLEACVAVSDANLRPGRCRTTFGFTGEICPWADIGGLSAGESCSGEIFGGCGEGTYCDQSAYPAFCAVCRPFTARGQPCGPDLAPCDGWSAGDFCDDITDPANPVCAARLTEGGVCGTAIDSFDSWACASGNCAGPSVCFNPTTGPDATDDPVDGCTAPNVEAPTCAGPLEPGELGDTCDWYPDCGPGLTCIEDGGISTCQPYRSSDEACDYEHQCTNMSHCVGDLCVSTLDRCGPGEEGATCIDDGDCQSDLYYCWIDECAPYVAADETCNWWGGQAEQCEAGYACLLSDAATGSYACLPAADPLANGEACYRDQDCTSRHCESGTWICADRLACTMP